ncbi:hypothetical protein HMPREF9069_01436 [Atopobium sp. oral taxon 810 str. F0209]|nr:hypothetical protein HMPREF9069_01436 [Atopobium sp. oral taxon 810 str. F0209]
MYSPLCAGWAGLTKKTPCAYAYHEAHILSAFPIVFVFRYQF